MSSMTVVLLDGEVHVARKSGHVDAGTGGLSASETAPRHLWDGFGLGDVQRIISLDTQIDGEAVEPSTTHVTIGRSPREVSAAELKCWCASGAHQGRLISVPQPRLGSDPRDAPELTSLQHAYVTDPRMSRAQLHLWNDGEGWRARSVGTSDTVLQPWGEPFRMGNRLSRLAHEISGPITLWLPDALGYRRVVLIPSSGNGHGAQRTDVVRGNHGGTVPSTQPEAWSFEPAHLEACVWLMGGTFSLPGRLYARPRKGVSKTRFRDYLRDLQKSLQARGVISPIYMDIDGLLQDPAEPAARKHHGEQVLAQLADLMLQRGLITYDTVAAFAQGGYASSQHPDFQLLLPSGRYADGSVSAASVDIK